MRTLSDHLLRRPASRERVEAHKRQMAVSDFPAVSDYEIPDTHDDRVDRTLAGDLIREHKANLAFDLPTPVRWQPQAPKPTLGAAILRALSRD